MKNSLGIFLFLVVLLVINILLIPSTSSQSTDKIDLVDKKAIRETGELLLFLKGLKGQHLLFGHHKTMNTGKGWKDPSAEFEKSDVLLSVGDYPAIFSFDFNQGFSELLPSVVKAAKLGGIITISWHARNFATGNNFYDTTGQVMKRILPGNDLNEVYLQQLDSISMFSRKLSQMAGPVPVIFRPFHENSGNWFWWGAKHCSPEVYQEVWHYTVRYLRDKKNVHNFLYAYSPSKPAQMKNESFEVRYPGNEYVDIIGFDYYGPDDYSAEFLENCRLVVEFAEKNNKVAAVTETGVRKGLQNTTIENWYMKCMLDPLKNDSIARKVSYMVTWTNSNNYWIPTVGDANYQGFKNFYEDEYTWFLKDINR